MFRNGKVLNKTLAGILTAACVVTSMPMGTFAAEADITADEAVVIEETAAEEVSDDVVEALDADAEVEEEEVFADETETEVNEAVEAAEEDAVPEDNDGEVDLSKAKVIKIGDNPQSGFASHENYAIYKFVAPVTGRYYINISSEEEPIEVHVFDGDKYVTSRTDGCYYKSFAEKTTKIENGEVDLIAGLNSYIVIMPWYYASTGINYSGLTISQDFEVTKSLKSEPTEVKFDKEYEGHLCADFNNSENYTFNANSNYYKFTMKEPGTFTFHIEDDSTNPKSEYTYYVICNDLDDYLAEHDRENNMSWEWWTHRKSDDFVTSSHNTWQFPDDSSEEAKISLLAGDYYIYIYSSLSRGNDKALNYKFALKNFKALKAGKNEGILYDTRLNGSNDKVDYTMTGSKQYYGKEEMPVIETNKFYNGILTEDSTDDFYHFTLTKAGPLYLTLESDDGIGNCFITLSYWSKTPGYEGCHELIMQGSKYSSTSDKPLNSKQLENSYYEDHRYSAKLQTKFPAGEYVLGINSKIDFDESKDIYLGESGQYRFNISTGKVTSKPVKSLKVNPATINLIKGDKATFTATVAPSNADDTGVTISGIEPSGIIEVNPVTSENPKAGVNEFEVRGLELGQTQITILTNANAAKKSQPIEQKCYVSVIEGKTGCPTIAQKQKVDLQSASYFGATFNKDDKFEISPAKYGSVNPKTGLYTANKVSDNITVTRLVKNSDGKYLATGAVSFKVAAPEYKVVDPKNAKKRIKSLVVKDKAVIDVNEYIGNPDLLPNYYECSDKKGVMSVDDTGRVTINKAGSAKVTVYYGYDKDAKKPAANAAKLVLTIKADTPIIKDAKVNKGKNGTLTVSKIPAGVTITKENWSVKAAEYDSATKTFKTLDTTTDLIDIAPVEVKGSFSKCTVTAKDKAGYAAVIVNVGGYEYTSYITVPEK